MQKLQLSIPEPCHENWQNMSLTDQGRFCNACAKEVIDFSAMTDIQVLNYFTNMTHEKVCGRALPEQLDRTLSRPAQPKKRLFWYWNYFVMFFMFFAKGNGAKAQRCNPIVTEEQLNIIRSGNVNIALAGKVAGYNKIVTGKVTDKDGNPVAFASITIKGTKTGTIADANGVYSLRINSNSILVISGASFKEVEVFIGTQSFINTVMEKSGIDIKEVVVTVAGGVMRRPVRKTVTESKDTTRIIKSTVIFEVKEDNTDLHIDKAAITITRKGDNFSDKILADNKGIYKFTEIKKNDSYFIKVEAAGYESNEFTIDAKDIEDREKPWEVLLKKQTAEIVQSTTKGEIRKEAAIRIGALQAFSLTEGPLYVVDGSIIPRNNADINPDDVESITILKGSEAAALFGPEGANGAIIITTRKAKEIKMKEVVVNSNFGCTRRSSRGGAVSYTYTYEDSFLTDTIATIKTLLTSSIKVYPNPVPRNTAFSVALKLKQAGNYSMQVTDVSGRILLQQKFNANAKDHTEKIMGDSRWAAGVYYIRVFDNKNQLISKTSFIFE